MASALARQEKLAPARGLLHSDWRLRGSLIFVKAWPRSRESANAAATEAFDAWCSRQGFPSGARLASMAPRVYNKVLVAYMQQLVVQAAAPSIGSDLLAGFMHMHQHTRGTLAESWKALRVWLNAVPSQTRPPLDDDVLDAMIVLALMWDWRWTALGLALARRGFLRPQELAILRVGQVKTVQHQGSMCVVQALVRSKTRFRASRLHAGSEDCR